MYHTTYDEREAGISGIGARCAALIERCAPRMMVAGGGGLPGLWREQAPVLTEKVKAAIREEWHVASTVRQEGVSSRQIMEAIAERHDVHYQTVCRVTRGLRGG